MQIPTNLTYVYCEQLSIQYNTKISLSASLTLGVGAWLTGTIEACQSMQRLKNNNNNNKTKISYQSRPKEKRVFINLNGRELEL